jgi:ATP-dependent Lon protease
MPDSRLEETARVLEHLAGYLERERVDLLLVAGDVLAEAIDLLSNRVPCEPGVAVVVAICSALKRHPTLPALVIAGDLSIKGNIKPLRSPGEPLQVALEAGARRVLLSVEDKRQFLEVSGEVVEKVDPIFYSDPPTAALKALGLV